MQQKDNKANEYHLLFQNVFFLGNTAHQHLNKFNNTLKELQENNIVDLGSNLIQNLQEQNSLGYCNFIGNITDNLKKKYDFFVYCFSDDSQLSSFNLQYDNLFFSWVETLSPRNLPVIPYDFSSDLFSLKTSLQSPSDKFRPVTIQNQVQIVHFVSENKLIEGFRYSDMELEAVGLELKEFENMRQEQRDCYLVVSVRNTQKHRRRIYIKSDLNEVRFQCKGLARVLEQFFKNKAKVVHNQELDLSDSTIKQALSALQNPNITSEELNKLNSLNIFNNPALIGAAEKQGLQICASRVSQLVTNGQFNLTNLTELNHQIKQNCTELSKRISPILTQISDCQLSIFNQDKCIQGFLRQKCFNLSLILPRTQDPTVIFILEQVNIKQNKIMEEVCEEFEKNYVRNVTERLKRDLVRMPFEGIISDGSIERKLKFLNESSGLEQQSVLQGNSFDGNQNKDENKGKMNNNTLKDLEINNNDKKCQVNIDLNNNDNAKNNNVKNESQNLNNKILNDKELNKINSSLNNDQDQQQKINTSFNDSNGQQSTNQNNSNQQKTSNGNSSINQDKDPNKLNNGNILKDKNQNMHKNSKNTTNPLDITNPNITTTPTKPNPSTTQPPQQPLSSVALAAPADLSPLSSPNSQAEFLKDQDSLMRVTSITGDWQLLKKQGQAFYENWQGLDKDQYHLFRIELFMMNQQQEDFSFDD